MTRYYEFFGAGFEPLRWQELGANPVASRRPGPATPASIEADCIVTSLDFLELKEKCVVTYRQTSPFQAEVPGHPSPIEFVRRKFGKSRWGSSFS